MGTAWFAVASLLCGLAPNVGTLVAARILQGVGGALLTPGSLAILQSSFRPEDRAAAVGAWSGLGGVAGAVGPFLGGGLVDGPGWRWAFLLNVPVAAAVIVCARAAVPETRDSHASGRLDARGAVYATAGLAAGTWALTEAGSRGWGDSAVRATAVIGVVALATFVLHVRRTASPLVPPALFRDRTFAVVNIGTVFLYAALGLSFFLVAFELQVAAGWSALRAGVALLPTTVLMLVLSARSGTLAQRIGPRLQLTVGPLAAAAGLALLAGIDEDANWATDVLPGALAFGVGLVTFVAPLTATVMAAADPAHVNLASGVNNAIARAASLAGIAVVPAVAGLATASGAAAVTESYRAAMLIAATLAAVAGVIMSVGLAAQGPSRPTVRDMHCAVDGPPLQPDPARCPASVSSAQGSP